MTAVKRPAKKAGTTPSSKVKLVQDLAEKFREFREAKTTADAATKKANELRDEVFMPALIKYGEAHGEKGQHLAIELPEPVDGLTKLVRRTNSSQLFDLDAAELLCKDKGILTEVSVGSIAIAGLPADRVEDVLKMLQEILDTEEIPAMVASRVDLDQDRLMAYHQGHRDADTAKATAKAAGRRKAGAVLSEDEIDTLFVDNITYSFFPER